MRDIGLSSHLMDEKLMLKQFKVPILPKHVKMSLGFKLESVSVLSALQLLAHPGGREPKRKRDRHVPCFLSL